MASLRKQVIRKIKKSVQSKFDHSEKIHFLHIGKNGGVQIRHLSKQINSKQSRYHIKTHPHQVHLYDLPPNDKYFFSIRNPVNRFVSGFYSRKRKGAPRFLREWSAHETRAFKDFEHANDLAEALYEEGELGAKAFRALKSIGHCSINQADWFSRCGYFLEIRPPVFIIRQENLSEDMKEFQTRIGFDGVLEEQTDPGLAHKFDYTGTPKLSEKAVKNLREWYWQDSTFYRQCEEWIATQVSKV